MVRNLDWIWVRTWPMWLLVTEMVELGSDMANVTFGHWNGRIGFGYVQCDFWSLKWPNWVLTWTFVHQNGQIGFGHGQMWLLVNFLSQNGRIGFGYGQCDFLSQKMLNWPNWVRICPMWLLVTEMAMWLFCHINVTFGHWNGRIGFWHGQCDCCSPKWPNWVWTWPNVTFG